VQGGWDNNSYLKFKHLNKLWLMIQWRLKWQKFVILAIASLTILVSTNITAFSKTYITHLPSAKTHPLPEFLSSWQDQENRGDYFDQVKSTPMGYLIWSRFPVTVYVEQPQAISNPATEKRFQEWVAAVKKAIAEWKVYFPLQEIGKQEEADIVILRSQPERKVKLNPDTGLYDIPRAVTAKTTYRFYLQQNPATIAHKMTMKISPDYTGVSLAATIRHELGHALGIWGHSSEKTDALYFSQVSDPPAISPRDLNTLKKIYQQDTRLGWKI
jgi:predicted Zn-dependent protease